VLSLAILSGAIVLWWLVLAACMPSGLRLVPPIPTDVKPTTFPARVSVIVPARNEEEALPRCLASLATQDMAPLEVLVVDDDSTDGTRAVAEAAGVRVVVPPKKPPGWMGKTWAAWQGAQSARGDWLLFVDADIQLAPAALRAAVAAAEARGAALLTATSRFECATAFEAIIQPALAMLIMMHMDPRRVSDPNDEHASASGGFLLFRREAYEAVGGHPAIRDQLMDDYRLALAVKSSKLSICVVNAVHLLRFRRPQSAGEHWHQWCRVFSGGLAGKRWLAFGGALSTAMGFSGPYAAAVFSLFAAPTPMTWILVGLACAQTCASVIVGRLLGMEARYVVLQPIGALFAVAVLLHAAVMPTGGARIRWRGRDLKV
jgi:cellulose synthase/poly-beta-1,6-N-acetylglucosamine synthase-like glycosyltransferase